MGHLGSGIIEERFDFVRPGLVTGGRAGGFEGSLEPSIEDLDSVFRRGGHARDAEDIAVVYGSGVDGVADGGACGCVDAW